MRRANLMLHCGAESLGFEAVEAVQTPERTDSWVPIPHNTLIRQVTDTLASNGMSVVTEAHALARDGQRYFGLFQVANANIALRNNDGDYGIVVGIRNSHDKSYPAGLVLGSQVFVCDNLSFSGEVKLSHKHTSRIVQNLPGLVNKAVGLLSDLRCKQDMRFQAYQEMALDDVHAHDIIIRALDTKAIAPPMVAAVL